MANNFHLTEEQSIKECKVLWKGIEKNNCTKHTYLNNFSKHLKMNLYVNHCPLCQWTYEYENDKNNKNVHPQIVDKELICREWNRICPLIMQYNKSCYQLGYDEYEATYTEEWFKAIENLKENKGES